MRPSLIDRVEAFLRPEQTRNEVMLVNAPRGSLAASTLEAFARDPETRRKHLVAFYAFPLAKGGVTATATRCIDFLISLAKQIHELAGGFPLPPGLREEALNRITQSARTLDAMAFYRRHIRDPMWKLENVHLTLIVLNVERCREEYNALIEILFRDLGPGAKWKTREKKNVNEENEGLEASSPPSSITVMTNNTIKTVVYSSREDFRFSLGNLVDPDACEMVTRVSKNPTDELVLELIVGRTQEALKRQSEAWDTEKCIALAKLANGSVAFARLLVREGAREWKSTEEAFKAMYEPWMGPYLSFRHHASSSLGNERGGGGGGGGGELGTPVGQHSSLLTMIPRSVREFLSPPPTETAKATFEFLSSLEEGVFLEWWFSKNTIETRRRDGEFVLAKVLSSLWSPEPLVINDTKGEDDVALSSSSQAALHATYHATEAKDPEAARLFFVDFPRLLSFFRAGGVDAILSEADIYLTAYPGDVTVRMIINALRMSRRGILRITFPRPSQLGVRGAGGGVLSEAEEESWITDSMTSDFISQLLGRLAGIPERRFRAPSTYEETQMNEADDTDNKNGARRERGEEDAAVWRRAEAELTNFTRAASAQALAKGWLRIAAPSMRKSADLLYRPMKGHADTVLCICALETEDGVALALTGSVDGSAKLWEVRTGRCLTTLDFGPSFDFYYDSRTKSTSHIEETVPYVSGVAMKSHPSLKRLLVCLCSCADNYGRLCYLYRVDGEGGGDDLARVEYRQLGAAKLLLAHEDTVNACALWDDSVGATAGCDGTLRVWSLPVVKETKKNNNDDDAVRVPEDQDAICTHSFTCSDAGKPLALYCVGFLGRSDLVIAGARDGSCFVFSSRGPPNVKNSPPLSRFTNHLAHVTSLSFTPDWKMMASTGWDCACRVWEVEEKEGAEAEGDEAEIAVPLEEGGRLVLRESATFVHDDWVWTCGFLPPQKRGEKSTRRLVATGADDGLLRVWSLDSRELVFVLDAMENSAVYTLALHRDYFLVGGNSPATMVYHVGNDSSLELSNPSLAPKLSVTLSHDKKHRRGNHGNNNNNGGGGNAVGANGNLSSPQGKVAVGAVAFSRALVFASTDESGTIRVFNRGTGRLVREVVGVHTCRVVSIEVGEEETGGSPTEGRRPLRVMSEDVKGYVRFWEADTGEPSVSCCADFLLLSCGLNRSRFAAESRLVGAAMGRIIGAVPGDPSCCSFENRVSAWVSADGRTVFAIEVASRAVHMLTRG